MVIYGIFQSYNVEISRRPAFHMIVCLSLELHITVPQKAPLK
jgi:hypothetical protein